MFAMEKGTVKLVVMIGLLDNDNLEGHNALKHLGDRACRQAKSSLYHTLLSILTSPLPLQAG